MGDTPTEDQDAFERHYNRFKNRDIPLAESERVLSDRVITQYLERNFNEQSGIPMDRIDFGVPGGISKIETNLIKAGEAHWNPDHSDGVVSDAVGYVTGFFVDPPSKTPEQSLSDDNARSYLARERDGTQVIGDIINRTPALSGFTLDDAKSIVRDDLAGANGTTAIAEKFPDADPNMLKAVAYTMLHVHKNDITEDDLSGHDFADMARGFMHYAHEDQESFSTWNADQNAQVVAALKANPEFIETLAKIKAPDNISTADELREQFAIREQIADTIATTFAQVHGVSDILDDDDITVIYKSAKDIENDGGMMGFMAFKEIGILNDETISLRYNPAYHLMDDRTYKAETDMEEAGFFMRAATEEVYHGIHQIQADRLVLGSLPEDQPIGHNAMMGALNWMTYTDGTVDHETYSGQYIESTAKEVADGVATSLIAHMENPHAIQSAEATTDPVNPIKL